MNILFKSFNISQNHCILSYHTKILISAKIITLKFTSVISCTITQINNQIKKRKAENEDTKSALIKEFLNTAKNQLLQTYKISN